MDSSSSPSRVGETLAGKYRIIRFLGEGGMGTVYEAQHEVVGRRFAVKVLHPKLACVDEMVERFGREAQAAGSLESEHIAAVVDFGHTDDGIPYIVMDYLVGEDLGKFLAREGPLPVPRAIDLIVQACRGLDAAHAAGIVHRDLKPENLFLCRRGDGSDLIKILDFGIAKLVSPVGDGPVTAVTRTGSAMGTPFYMPPEQARGAKDLDLRADVYSLGVILYEALTGQKPHPGESYNTIFYHILTQPPTPIATLRPGLPADLVEVVHRALSPEPSDRPASAMELAAALGRHAGRPATPRRSQFELPVTLDSGGSRTRHRSRHRVPIAVGIALVVAVAAGVLLLIGGGANEAPMGNANRDPGAAPQPPVERAAAAGPAPAAALTEPPLPADEHLRPPPARAGVRRPASSRGSLSRSAPARRKAPNDQVGRASSSHPKFDSSNPYE